MDLDFITSLTANGKIIVFDKVVFNGFVLIFKEMESRVEAIWEKMNKGVSNKTAKSFSNKRNVSTVNASSKKANNVRMFSLSSSFEWDFSCIGG